MSNWVSNDIEIKSNNKEQISELLGNLYKWIWETRYPDKNLDDLEKLIKSAELKNISAKGFIDDIYDEDKNTIYLHVSTRNSPQNELWFALAKKYLDNPTVLFVSYDEGQDFFITNRKDFVDKYWLEFFDPCDGKLFDDIDDEINYMAEEEWVRSILQKYLKTNDDNLEHLLQRLENDPYWSKRIIIHKWEYSDI